MREGIAYLSFTARGAALAERLRTALGGEASRARGDPGLTLDGWTAARFPVKRALVYIGAAGIAVRAVAPYLRGKTEDPAVVAADEYGRFVIPLVSGHWGGANDLARAIAAVSGGTAVITTATDLNGAFAADEWARRQGCAIIKPETVKTVSGKALAGGTIQIVSAFPIAGTPPKGVKCMDAGAGGVLEADADIWIDLYRRPPLWLAPKALILGAGCRRGTARETLERRFTALCEETRLCPEAFRAAATIDRKAEEPGLLSFCAAHGWPAHAFSAEALRRVPGTFTASAFVEGQTGVDNVCERAALRAAALYGGGELLVKKYAGEGVTLAVARIPVQLSWDPPAGNAAGESESRPPASWSAFDRSGGDALHNIPL